MRIKNKKGQEEMVGFALIVIIVAVVGVVLLGFALRNPGESSEASSVEVNQFLESLAHVTSDCDYNSRNDFASMEELARECYTNPADTCTGSEENVCNALNESLKGIISKGLDIGTEKYYEGFEMNIGFEPKEVGEEEVEIISLKEGSCEGRKVGGEYLISSSRARGSIAMNLVLCLE
ncbi:MAG: hypothetical protein AABW80_04470 [Nanoarchaeota archaeon]